MVGDKRNIVFDCLYARFCWFKLSTIFNIQWDNTFRGNTAQLLIGPSLNSKAKLLWSNTVKATLSEFVILRLLLFIE